MSGQIRFDDGAAYEKMMGTWSRIVGEQFIDWVAPPPGLRWVDVGCGNGASTELLMRRCAPASVQGVDPSPEQLAYARDRAGAAGAEFQLGDAMALPYPDGAFDAAVAALVLFFVPDPAKAVAEMVRVTRPGGLVCAYMWNIPGGGLPHAAIGQELRAGGITPPMPPSAPISAMEPLRQLFADAGLTGIETVEITGQRRFENFDDWFATSLLGSSLTIVAEQVGAQAMNAVKERVRGHYPGEGDGPVTRTARANAIKATKPA